MSKNPEETWLLQALASEPDNVIERRESLTAKKNRLDKALNTFSERLGQSTINKIKMKAASSPHQTPSSQVGTNGSLLPNAELGIAQRAERRPSSSGGTPSSPSSSASATSGPSENSSLTVPSQGRSPKNSSRGLRSRSSSKSASQAPLIQVGSQVSDIPNREFQQNELDQAGYEL